MFDAVQFDKFARALVRIGVTACGERAVGYPELLVLIGAEGEPDVAVPGYLPRCGPLWTDQRRGRIRRDEGRHLSTGRRPEHAGVRGLAHH